jgi:anti-sigma factor RsiW
MPPKSKAAAAAAAEPAAVEDLFSALHRHIEAGEFPQAVKVADQGQALHTPLLLLSPRRASRAMMPKSLTPRG